MAKLIVGLFVSLVLMAAKLYVAVILAIIGGIFSLLVAGISAVSGRNHSAGSHSRVERWKD